MTERDGAGPEHLYHYECSPRTCDFVNDAVAAANATREPQVRNFEGFTFDDIVQIVQRNRPDSLKTASEIIDFVTRRKPALAATDVRVEPDIPWDCEINPVWSGACSRGTKACIANHEPAAPSSEAEEQCAFVLQPKVVCGIQRCREHKKYHGHDFVSPAASEPQEHLGHAFVPSENERERCAICGERSYHARKPIPATRTLEKFHLEFAEMAAARLEACKTMQYIPAALRFMAATIGALDALLPFIDQHEGQGSG